MNEIDKMRKRDRQFLCYIAVLCAAALALIAASHYYKSQKGWQVVNTSTGRVVFDAQSEIECKHFAYTFNRESLRGGRCDAPFSAPFSCQRAKPYGER